MDKPKWKVEVAIQAGQKAHAMVTAERKDFEPRLEPGVIDGLASDVDVARGKQTGAGEARAAQAAATADQDALLEQGAQKLTAVRAAVRRKHPRNGKIRTLVGVGDKTPNTVAAVATGLGKLEKAAQAEPDLLRTAGVLPSDIDAITALRTALVGADSKQSKAKASAAAATLDRKVAQVRIERAVDQIVGVAELIYPAGSAKLEAFRGLIPSKTTKAQETEEPSEGEEQSA